MIGPVTRKCVSVAADAKVGLTQGLAHGGPGDKRFGEKPLWVGRAIRTPHVDGPLAEGLLVILRKPSKLEQLNTPNAVLSREAQDLVFLWQVAATEDAGYDELRVVANPV